jgi:hypothetical protein
MIVAIDADRTVDAGSIQDCFAIDTGAAQHFVQPKFKFSVKSDLELKPDFSPVAMDSVSAHARSAIDMQLLLIQDKVNRGEMIFPDNFELL